MQEWKSSVDEVIQELIGINLVYGQGRMELGVIRLCGERKFCRLEGSEEQGEC